MSSESSATPRFLLFDYSELNPAFRSNPLDLFDPQRALRLVEHDGILPAMLIATYRDPGHFKNPHEFDIDRRSNPHIAFGAGAHKCIGAPLARLEGQMAIRKFWNAFRQRAALIQQSPTGGRCPMCAGLVGSMSW